MRYQYLRVLDYLKDRKVCTTDELRQMAINQGAPIVDIPKCVSTLVDKGYPIESKRNANGSATYYWQGKPKLQFNDFIFTKDGRAIRKEPPKQEALI